MAQKQKAARQAKDPYAQRSKELGSAVQRLRGWVGSDPSRLAELGDALVALTGHRLRGHEHAAAGADAQDSVKQAAQLLTAGGAVGAYTEAADAARYVTAVVQLANVQAGLGLAEAAGRTIASLDELSEQFLALRLELPLEPEVIIRALLCAAGAALASGDVATAGAAADDALRRLVAAGLDSDPDAAYLALDVLRLVADTRWAAGRPSESLAHLHQARDRWAAVVDGRLDAPAGLSPSLAARLAAPAPTLHRDLADRLVATRELDLGLVTRRSLVDLLRRLEGRTGTSTQRPLATALADLAADLLAADRLDEADEESAAALAILAPRGEVSWPVVVRAQVLGRSDRAAEAVALLQERSLPEAPSAVTGLVHHALAQCHRALGELQEAEGSEQARDQVMGQLGLDHVDRLVDRTRGVLTPGAAQVSWPASGATVWDRLTGTSNAPAAAPADPGADDWLEAERKEAHRAEERRAAQAREEATRREDEERQRTAAAAREAEHEAARQLAEQEAEVARRAAAEEAERQETKRRRQERLEAYRLEAERRAAEEAGSGGAAEEAGAPAGQPVAPSAPVAEPEPGEPEPAELAPPAPPELAPGAVGPDPLDLAREAWQQARAAGDRRTTRDAADRLVEVLRPRADADLGQHGPLLQQVLSDLAGLRMRGGDLRGARAASKEARELNRRLGR